MMMFLVYFLISAAALALLLFSAYILIFVRPGRCGKVNKALLTEYAHRGLFGGDVPENSLAAFKNARDAGYGIELDLQLSGDGTVMVFHDYTLIRMTGKDGKLSEKTAAELSALTLCDSDQHIPTFREVLELVDGKVPILIELKGEDLNSSLCERAAEILKDYRGDYCIESFNPLLIKSIKKYLPDVYTGQLYTNVCRDKKKYSPLNILLSIMAFNFIAKPDFIAYNKEDRSSIPVKLACGLYRAPRFVWTVKTESELRDAVKYGECPIFEAPATEDENEAKK